jgi:hypothetical protein
MEKGESANVSVTPIEKAACLRRQVILIEDQIGSALTQAVC